MQVDSKRIVELKFHNTKRIITTGRLSNNIREIGSAKRFPINMIWVEHFTCFVKYLIVTPLQKIGVLLYSRQQFPDGYFVRNHPIRVEDDFRNDAGKCRCGGLISCLQSL